jgi:hypothetical protein
LPIKRELRWFYPIDWPEISRRVRFERAGGVCEGCGRPHGETVRCLPDGRWFDAARRTWRSGRGRPARWPDIEDAVAFRQTRVILAAAHLDHDPGNNRQRNLKSLCQRCHMIHDRSYHLARRRITYLLRRALGDLFLGPYSARSTLAEVRGPKSGSTDIQHSLSRAIRFRTSELDRDAQQGLELGLP